MSETERLGGNCEGEWTGSCLSQTAKVALRSGPADRLFVEMCFIGFANFHGKLVGHSKTGQSTVNMQGIEEVSDFVHQKTGRLSKKEKHHYSSVLESSSCSIIYRKNGKVAKCPRRLRCNADLPILLPLPSRCRQSEIFLNRKSAAILLPC